MSATVHSRKCVKNRRVQIILAYFVMKTPSSPDKSIMLPGNEHEKTVQHGVDDGHNLFYFGFYCRKLDERGLTLRISSDSF